MDDITMNLAVNYSEAAADLLEKGQIAIDRFKCPAWPDLIATVRHIHPTYVHFPLTAGQGIGNAFDMETHEVADWSTIEGLLTHTNTPFVNIHLAPTVRDHVDIPADTQEPEHVERLITCLIRDVRAVVEQFGPERVIVENDHDNGGKYLRPALLPDVIHRVVDETGCGLLLDISHARLAARHLGMDAWEYIHALPVERLREIHVTGIQHFDARWVGLLCRAGVDAGVIQGLAGRQVDHLPLITDDWAFAAQSLDHIRRGVWGQPWIVALEYGGVGPVWEAVAEMEVLREQVPRLYELVKACRVPESA
jgi:uncharacterized protein (UPF0276 family)